MQTKRPVIIPIGPSIAYVELTQGKWACIDAEDAGRLGAHNWCAMKSPYSEDFYAVRAGSLNANGVRVHVRMHTEVIGKHKGKTPDHKSGFTLDNRKQNLRAATKVQNAFNMKVRSDNVSGCTGVSYVSSVDRWQVVLTVEGKRTHYGYFKEKDKAVNICTDLKEKLHGEFRRVA